MMETHSQVGVQHLEQDPVPDRAKTVFRQVGAEKSGRLDVHLVFYLSVSDTELGVKDCAKHSCRKQIPRKRCRK